MNSHVAKEAPVWKPDRRTAAERLVDDWAAYCARRARPEAPERLTEEALKRHGFDPALRAQATVSEAVEYEAVPHKAASPDEIEAILERAKTVWSQEALAWSQEALAPPDQDPDAAPRITHRGGRPPKYDWAGAEAELERMCNLYGGVPDESVPHTTGARKRTPAAISSMISCGWTASRSCRRCEEKSGRCSTASPPKSRVMEP